MEAYGDIGNMLKAAREEMKLSLRDAAGSLHIRAYYLEAMEAGRFEEMPGHAYAKGYLQSYATFLQLDKEEILRRFEEGENALKRGFYLPPALSQEKKPSKQMVWGGLAAAALVFLLWALVTQPRGSVSVVDAPPQAFPHAPRQHTCFKPNETVYPPCYWSRADFELLPLRPMNSVMEFTP